MIKNTDSGARPGTGRAFAVNIPEVSKKRVVIAGAGFAGLKVARKLSSKGYQVVLLDKNNYHQFQPLFYQVAMSGLEPSSISFPLRKLFQKKGVHVRMVELKKVQPEKNRLITTLGHLNYDILVLACGAVTNYYGNEQVRKNALPLKSTSEALYIRNQILSDFERAIGTVDYDKRQYLVDIVIVGGGPTGVELAGSLAEMKKYVLPKDYPDFDHREVDIYLVEGESRLLAGMSKKASEKAEEYLRNLGVKVVLNQMVTEYDGEVVKFNNGESLTVRKVIWAAGVKGTPVPGLPEESIGKFGRLLVDEYNRLKKSDNIFAIGDLALMKTEEYPQGHPQVAQVAIQQGKWLARNLNRRIQQKKMLPFNYKDKGTMATVGRSKAVADLNKLRLSGFVAWFIWLWVHLFSLIGTRNKVIVMINWFWNYVSYDQALRLIIRPYRQQRKQPLSTVKSPEEQE